MNARILPMGDRALLIEVAGLAEVLALRTGLAASRPDGVIDLVPAARTLLVRVDPRTLTLAATRAWVHRIASAGPDAAPSAAEESAPVELDVAYDGADLSATAELLGVEPAELVRRHVDAVWEVAFTGFTPGFGYLVSTDWPFDIPRLDTPRTRVPAGAVGLAAGFTGAYPRETPGGWRLIGTTPVRLFDSDAVPPASPALLAPGTVVRFRPVAPHASPAQPEPLPPSSRAPRETALERPDVGKNPQSRPAVAVSRSGQPRSGEPRMTAITVVEPGLLTTIQDLGRPGRAALGIATSGALDRAALRTANRLIGNRDGDAGLEVTMGGLRAVAARDLWFAVTGAWGRILLGDREVDPYEAHAWPVGVALVLDWFTHGARAYLAVRGGFDTALAVGSRSTDIMSGLGPARLRAGSLLAVGDAAAPIPVVDLAPWGPPRDDVLDVELAPGPRGDWFAASAHEALYGQFWTVTNDADRVGLRLDGPELARVRAGELPSEAMVPGSLQVPPSGRPTILLADGPVTGGYPVIAVTTDAALDSLAQARPGSRIRFRHARPAL